MNAPTINKLLTALNECTEWGQVFILDALSNYSPRDAREAHSICERITRASRMPTPPSCSPPSRYARVGHAAPERAAVLDTGRARRLLAARRTPSASASRRASRMPTPPSCSPPSRYARVGHAAPERAAVLDTGRARRLLAARRTPSASASRRARACQRRRRALRRQGTPAWGTQRRERAAVLDTGREATPGREAHSICERITPRLAHANAAVVLSAVKVLMKLMEMVASDTELVSTLSRKLAPPLVTLLSAEPEVQYVALRNINLVVQKRPDILKHEMKVFFVKYNDPIYVKLEKLDIMIRLASQANIAQVLGELKEYATEVDVDFVRKAVRAIGRCAIKLDKSR
ncbi:uncharacterized protein [Choristoneura fumiferana]|uniref:uncharacterized protein n=1 Tax=Choristoneura fumiferana TaxID=7141 RepID=UPI003D15A6C7